MPDWTTILLSVILSTASALLLTLYYTERVWRRRLGFILSSLRTYRDLRRVVARTSRRPRRRYIVFEVLTSGNIGQGSLEEAIKDQVRRVLGASGLVGSGVDLIQYDEARRRGILRVRSDYKYSIIGILGLVRNVDGARVLIIPLAVTGSIKRARRLMEGIGR